MRSKFLFWASAFWLLSGILLGILFQKFYPVDSLLLRGERALPRNEKLEERILKSGHTGVEIPKEALGNLDLFILAGQSNMSGYGEINSDEVEIVPKAFVFGNDYHWRLAREPIDDPTGQVDLVSMDTEAGYSCGTAFAKALLGYYPNSFIGLIPCAKGGSSIEEWRRNLSENSLYGSCLKRTLAASPMGKIKGLLFFQGETDAMDPSLESQRVKYPFQWREKFSNLVRDFRNDLKIQNLPVVFAQIGSNKDPEAFKNWKIVQEEQSHVRLPDCKMIKTDDLSLRDEVHFDSKSYRIIGERFASAVVELMSKRHSQ